MAEHGSRSVITSTIVPGVYAEENVAPFFWKHAMDLRCAFDPPHEVVGRCQDRCVELFYEIPVCGGGLAVLFMSAENLP